MCDAAGGVADLLAAGGAGGDEEHVRGCLADRGEERLLADFHGDLVVLRLEAEGAGHAAAAGQDLADLQARDEAQGVEGGTRAEQRLLVTVAMEQGAARA